jgi:hypothetical protein
VALSSPSSTLEQVVVGGMGGALCVDTPAVSYVGFGLA